MFTASLAASQFIQNLTAMSIESMIEEGLVGRALATLMYHPVRLQQVGIAARNVGNFWSMYSGTDT